MRSRGRILEFKKSTTQRAVTGIRGGRGYQRTPFGYYNGYGSACAYPETSYFIVASIYEPVKTTVYVDITNEIHDYSGRSRITQQYLHYLNEENAGKKIWFCDDSGDWDVEDYDDITF